LRFVKAVESIPFCCLESISEVGFAVNDKTALMYEKNSSRLFVHCWACSLLVVDEQR